LTENLFVIEKRIFGFLWVQFKGWYNQKNLPQEYLFSTELEAKQSLKYYIEDRYSKIKVVEYVTIVL